MRVLLGFLLAPLSPALVAWLLTLAPTASGIDHAGPFFALCVIYGYPVAALFGVPSYILFQRKRWMKFWQVTAAGLVAGSLIPICFAGLMAAYRIRSTGLLEGLQRTAQEMVWLVMFGMAVGCVSGAAFFVIALYRSTQAGASGAA